MWDALKLLDTTWLHAAVCRHNYHERGKKNTLHCACSYMAAASPSSCAQVSSTSAGFSSWLTVSITIRGMIGSFKSVLKRLALYLPLPGLLPSRNSFCSLDVEMCCIGLLLRHGYCSFGFVTQILLLYFWVMYTYEWRLMPESSMCWYYPIKLGCSVAPEIVLKCNINAAILWILPLWNTKSPPDAMFMFWWVGFVGRGCFT